MFKRMIVSLSLSVVFFTHAFAVDLELTQGQSKALPIALVPFAGDEDSFLSGIIKKDLSHSGAFNFVKFDAAQSPHNALSTKFSYWKNIGANNLVVGDIEALGDRFSVHFQLLDPVSRSHIMLSREYTVSKKQFRALAHHISDLIYQQLTGRKGIFSTRLSYIIVDRTEAGVPSYRLEVSDYDGNNPEVLLKSSQPIMSPSWSPDSTKIAYVSFENKKSEIYVVNVSSGKRQLISSFSGINGAPTWSPDMKQLALVLSKSGSPKIYLYSFSNKKFEQLTSGLGIDTEPSFSLDGKDIIFTSNRGGSPQIYKISLVNKNIKRMTFIGNYNASASYTPLAKELVLLHRDDNAFSISLQDISSGVMTPLTFSKHDESPSLAPNGQMMVYASRLANKGILKISSLDGKVNFRLPNNKGDMQEPSWSSYLK